MNRKMLRQAQKQSEKFQKDMAKMQQKLDSEMVEPNGNTIVLFFFILFIIIQWIIESIEAKKIIIRAL